MTTWITICDTCKREGWDAEAGDPTDGELLAALIEERAAQTDIKTRRVSCLMGCDNGCNVAIQADGKLCYTLGNFEVSEEAAQGVVDYAKSHAESESGQVPYRNWPQAVKGHFITRHHPLPDSE